MNIFVCCATKRGYRVLEKLLALRPADRFWVFAFRETPEEPPFVDSIRELAFRHGACFYETRAVGSAELAHVWNENAVDVMFVISWRYMIPMWIAERCSKGCYVLHDSLLPVYRGFSPTVWAIANGEPATGATLFRMAEAVDAGDIVDQLTIPISSDAVVAEIMDLVTNAYNALVERNLDRILLGEAPRRPQDHTAASYTCKRTLEDNRIDWRQPTKAIHNLIRAVSQPYPGTFTTLNGARLTIWSAVPVKDPRTYVGRVPGRVVQVVPGQGVVVLTGDGELLVKMIQLEGREPQCASEILRSLSMQLGA